MAPSGKPAARKPSAKPATGLKAEQQRLSRLAKQDKRTARSATKQQRMEIRKFTRVSRGRRIIGFSILGAFAALVSLVLATMFTPLMSIQEIKIVGAHRLKAATIKNSVMTLMDTPLTMVNEADLEKRLASFSLIQSFTTISLPPHTLQINIVERQPIAIVQTTSGGYLYDPAGVLIGPTKATWKYPTVVVGGDPRHSANYRAAIDVLLALPVELYPKVQRIRATSKDDVRLELRGAANQQILWGDSSKSIMKSKVLEALIANTKKSATVTYDVSSPSAPTVRYGSF
jgi:cell division protein FtsQ